MPVNPNIEAELGALYKKKKEEEILNQQSSFDYQSAEDRLVLDYGYTVCRVLDMPVQCESSFIKCDDGKVRLFKFPSIAEKPDFILYKILNKVLFQKFNGTDKHGKPIIEVPVKENNSEIYWMVYNNGETILGQYGANGWGSWKKVLGKYQGASSSSSCFMNVINRRDFEYKRKVKNDHGEFVEEIASYNKTWCVEHKHSLLLCKNANSVGAAITVMNLLINDIFRNYGNFIKYDISINRLKKDPYYQISRAQDCTNNQDIMPYVIKGDLTPEEMSIDLYDTQEMSKPTSYATIYNFLKDKISKIDMALGTSFLKELEDKATYDNKPKSVASVTESEVKEEVTQDPSDLPHEGPSKEELPQEGPAKEEPPKEEEKPAVRERVVSDDKGSVQMIDILAKVRQESGKEVSVLGLISEDEKKLIKGLTSDGKGLEFTTKDISACPKCKMAQPTLISSYCLFCGEKY